jgi:cobalt-zinc-cadmium resistance protein CzcA
LATVVIGGLITATALTTCGTSCTVYLFHKSSFKMRKPKTLPTAILLLGFSVYRL